MAHDYRYPKYMSVGEREELACAALERLRRSRPDISPVTIAGRALALTWWGKAWNRNLESYADYAYRIQRGRSYVRHQAVLDLRVRPGLVEALVQGGEAKPYKITITIKPLEPDAWQRIISASGGAIDSLSELLEGEFPKALADLFTGHDAGLFPSPKDIALRCDCPDWAAMCKHVSAALYGVGARLDDNPALFFVLRGVNVEDLISRAVSEKSAKLLEKSGTKSRRVIEEPDLETLFGIDLDDESEDSQPENRALTSSAPKSSTSKKRRKTETR